MGAGASAGAAADAQTESREAAAASGDFAAQTALTVEENAGAATGDTAAKASAAAAALVASLPGDLEDTARGVVSKVASLLTAAQLEHAAELFAGCGEALLGSAALVALGAALAQCGDMAPELVGVVGTALSFLGNHLGPLSVAAGFLGAIVYTFELSRDQDKNVQTVMLWAASVRDWLLLVADRIERSSAESTLPLFVGLKDEMAGMFAQIAKHNKQCRVGKMLFSTSFQRNFERAKASVLELKTALRDFLDQESQDAQEKQLALVVSSSVEVSAKLETMDEQLLEIRALLLEQRNTAQGSQLVLRDAAQGSQIVQQREPASPTQRQLSAPVEEEDQIYFNIKRAAGGAGDDVGFSDFVTAFECFFLGGGDMRSEQRRGLRIAIDRGSSGRVSKVAWIKFYRNWRGSDATMQDYVAKLAADAPPTLCATAKGTAFTAATAAKGTAVAATTAAAKSAAVRLDAAAKLAEASGYGKAAQRLDQAAKVAQLTGLRVSLPSKAGSFFKNRTKDPT